MDMLREEYEVAREQAEYIRAERARAQVEEARWHAERLRSQRIDYGNFSYDEVRQLMPAREENREAVLRMAQQDRAAAATQSNRWAGVAQQLQNMPRDEIVRRIERGSSDMMDAMRYSINAQMFGHQGFDPSRQAEPRMAIMNMNVRVDPYCDDDAIYVLSERSNGRHSRAAIRDTMEEGEAIIFAIEAARNYHERQFGRLPDTLYMSPRTHHHLMNHINGVTPKLKLGVEGERFSDQMEVALEELSKELTA